MTSIMHIFQVFRVFNNITVFMRISCHNLFVISCLSLCFHLAKIDQAGGPETF